MSHFRTFVEYAGVFAEAAGVLVVVSGLVLATLRFAYEVLRQRSADRLTRYRQALGRRANAR